MSFFSRLDRHSNLVAEMADTLGVDLVDASVSGMAPETTLRSAVLNCMGCGQTADCAEWLADHANGAGATPHYCRNKELLDRLSTL